MKKDFLLNGNRPLSALVSPLLAWYGANKRVLPWRENRDPYRIWISEIMLQQTRVEAAKIYYERFLRALPDVKALAEVPEDALMKLWEGLGYYSRAKNLQKAARMICEKHGGVFPTGFDEIRALPGIGPYTAGAISSIAFEQPTPAVDGNVLRVITRLCRDSGNIMDDGFRRCVTDALREIYPETGRGDFTQSLMELGAIVCLPNGAPLCGECPLRELCAAHAAGEEISYPVLPEKKPRRSETYTVFLIRHGDRLAIGKRPDNGLLAGLWELPHADGALNEAQAAKWLATQGIRPDSLCKGSTKKHIFTHIEWQMPSYTVGVSDECPGFVWATPGQLSDEYSLPTAFRKFLPKAK